MTAIIAAGSQSEAVRMLAAALTGAWVIALIAIRIAEGKP